MMHEEKGRKRPFPAPDAGDDGGGISYSVGFDLSRFTGTTLVVGETVTLSDAGILVLASGSGADAEANAYSFVDGDGQGMGGLYGRDDAHQTVISLRAADEAAAGEAVILNLSAAADATADSTAAATVNLAATRVGEGVDTAVTVQRSDTVSRVTVQAGGPDGAVRLGPRLDLLGAAGEQAALYLSGSLLVIRYSEGGTPRYKYLDLSGTAVSWSYSGSPP